MHDTTHQTVLLQEAVVGLSIVPEGVYVDATFGRGGHSRLILQRLGPHGRLIALDRDPDAVAAAHEIRDPRFEVIHAPFGQLAHCLEKKGVSKIDGLLIDLGVSSPQIDQAERGFSFRTEGPLDMRMDPSCGEPVSQWIARASKQELRKVIADYGEERFAVQIADAIAARCHAALAGEAQPLASTRELADLVEQTLRRCRAKREPGQHPATRTFQALRIHINGEIEQLTSVLEASVQLLRPGGRIAIISFHSLEDRIVKQFLRGQPVMSRSLRRGLSRTQRALCQGPGELAPVQKFRELSRVRPSPEEVLRNPRSRSAVLRIAERLPSSREGVL
jgi:16S rRNA (cytosine1402-N4)-methyltransferase